MCNTRVVVHGVRAILSRDTHHSQTWEGPADGNQIQQLLQGSKIFVFLFYALKMSSTANQTSVYRFASGGQFGHGLHNLPAQLGLQAERTVQGVWGSSEMSPSGMPRFRVSEFFELLYFGYGDSLTSTVFCGCCFVFPQCTWLVTESWSRVNHTLDLNCMQVWLFFIACEYFWGRFLRFVPSPRFFFLS